MDEDDFLSFIETLSPGEKRLITEEIRRQRQMAVQAYKAELVPSFAEMQIDLDSIRSRLARKERVLHRVRLLLDEINVERDPSHQIGWMLDRVRRIVGDSD